MSRSDDYFFPRPQDGTIFVIGKSQTVTQKMSDSFPETFPAHGFPSSPTQLFACALIRYISSYGLFLGFKDCPMNFQMIFPWATHYQISCMSAQKPSAWTPNSSMTGSPCCKILSVAWFERVSAIRVLSGPEVICGGSQ